MAGDILAIALLGLMLLLGLGLALVVLVLVGGALFEVRSLRRRRRAPSGYRRQLLAAERGRRRLRCRRGTNPSGITIYLDTLPPGLGKRKP